MDMTVVWVGVGVVAVGVAGFLCYKALSGNPTKMTEIVNNISDDQLVVDKLYGKELSSWFKEKNSENKYANIILYPTEKNIRQFKLPKGMINDSCNQILQFLYDETADEIILTRSVIFETMDASLSDMLEKNDGVLIIK